MKLRPTNFEQFIGQKNLVAMLKIFCEISKKEKTNFRHCLFYGLPGTGKTSLAQIIANELKVNLHSINATNIKTQADLINLFSLVETNDVVFIDELHSIDEKVLELLYPMMEDFVIDIPIGKDFNKRSTRIEINKFTLIAATTSIGKIPKPLVDRFQLVYKLDNYSNQELFEILKQLNDKEKIKYLIDEELHNIASHCKENPRIAINIFLQAIDFKKYDIKISINDILSKLKIHQYGLTDADLEYLNIINNNESKTLGIKTLMQITGYDSFTIENYIEPYLFKLQLLQKTNKGRKLTTKDEKLIQTIKN